MMQLKDRWLLHQLVQVANASSVSREFNRNNEGMKDSTLR
jgi:hypothetical protein